MAEGLEVLGKLREAFCERPFKDQNVRALLSNSKLLGCLLTQLEPEVDKATISFRPIRPGILLHYAATFGDISILSTVLALYKRRKCLSKALLTRNMFQETPLQAALSVYEIHLSSVMLLFSTCQEVAPGAIQMTDKNGYNLLHSVLRWDPPCSFVLSVVQFLLAQKECKPLLLQKATVWCDYAATPLQQAMRHSASAKAHIEMEQRSSRPVSQQKKTTLKVYSDVQRMLEIASAEMEVADVLRAASSVEQERVKTKRQEIAALMQQHIENDNWHIAAKFLFVDDEEAALMALSEMIDYILTTETPVNPELPLNKDTTRKLKELLQWSTSTIDLSYIMWYLYFSSSSAEKRELLWMEEGLLAKVVSKLTLPDANLQTACTELLKNVAETKGERDCSSWIQPLHVVKEFSSSSHARRTADKVLGMLRVAQPLDPSQWGTSEVCSWMLNQKHLDLRETYADSFVDNGIDGLHLLELTTQELTSLGVQSALEQKTIMDLIDDLRELKRRARIGRKDIFLSYSHVNLRTARKLKEALNAADYSVWIDEAGIRPGHKWRNEIADGIENCKAVLFLLDERSAQSVYCHDELGLAEDMKRFIITVECEKVKHIDPGLRLIIMSRQWISFGSDEEFDRNVSQLTAALGSNGVSPSGAGVDRLEEAEHQGVPHSTSSKALSTITGRNLGHSHHTLKTGTSDDLAEWKMAMGQLLQGMDQRLTHIEERVKHLSTTAVEKQQAK